MDKEFYGTEEQERLDPDPEQTVRDLLEGEEDYSDFPIRVYIYKPMEVIKKLEQFAENIIEDILNNLDDTYGDPNGDYTEATVEMKEAALKLAVVVKEEYQPWLCEPTGEVLEFSKEEAKEIVGSDI